MPILLWLLGLPISLIIILMCRDRARRRSREQGRTSARKQGCRQNSCESPGHEAVRGVAEKPFMNVYVFPSCGVTEELAPYKLEGTSRAHNHRRL